MPTTAKELFERGKSYFDEKKWDEAFNKFSEAIRLEPDNANYYAWLARVLYQKSDYSRALELANKAIQVDSRCAIAYRVRGGVYRDQKNYSSALQDYSEAIRLNPKDEIALYWRAGVYDALSNYQNAIADRARYYEFSSKHQYTVADKEFDPWVQAIHGHFTNALLPQMRSAGERFIEYWPCYLIFGRREKESLVDGYSYVHIYGSYGTGYLCLSDKNILIVSLRQLTHQFPAYKKPGVFGSILLGGLGREFHHLEPEKEDKLWVVPNHSVSDARIYEDHINLTAPIVTCEIMRYFTGHLPMILAGINMAMSGKLAAIWAASEPVTLAQPGTDVISLLKQLGDLKAQGIITEAEFEQKKKELLSRL